MKFKIGDKVSFRNMDGRSGVGIIESVFQHTICANSPLYRLQNNLIQSKQFAKRFNETACTSSEWNVREHKMQHFNLSIKSLITSKFV